MTQDHARVGGLLECDCHGNRAVQDAQPVLQTFFLIIYSKIHSSPPSVSKFAKESLEASEVEPRPK